MPQHTIVTMTDAHESERCCVCGSTGPSASMVHLGNHPEVALCRPCARWAAKQAWQLDDRDRTGPLVAARTGFRRLRRTVVEHGWHRSPVFGGLLRWIGKRLP